MVGEKSFRGWPRGFPGGSDCEESAHNAVDPCSIPGLGRSPGEGNGYPLHSSILAWRIPWTEEPGGLQSMGLQGVRHDWATHTMGAEWSWDWKEDMMTWETFRRWTWVWSSCGGWEQGLGDGRMIHESWPVQTEWQLWPCSPQTA